MNTKFKIALAVVVGAALGAAAMQGLHAQAKPKAYSVTETEVLDAAAKPCIPRLSGLRKRLPVLAISARLAEGLLQSRGRRLPSVWPSPSGTAWSRRRHSTTRKPGRTLRRSVTRRSRQYGGTSSKPELGPSRAWLRHAVGTHNWQQLRLPRPPHRAASTRD